MRLPAQIQKQAERADQLIADFTKGNAGEGKPAGDPATEPVPTQDAGVAANQDAAQPGGEGTPEPVPTGDPAQSKDRTDWKAKYYTLQGMFNAEVPRLHKNLKAANDRIHELESSLASAGKPAQATDGQPDPSDPLIIPAELREALGEDAVKAIERVFAKQDARIESKLKPVQEKVEATATVSKEVAERQAQAAQQAFLAELTRRVPDWQQIDELEDWHHYLAAIDPIARKQRQELLMGAYQAGDIDAVQAIFEAFKVHAGIRATAPAPSAEPTRAERLARQVTPTSAASAPSRSPEKKIWTKPEIVEFYKQVALGKIPAAKVVEIETDIMAAQSEGRIR